MSASRMLTRIAMVAVALTVAPACTRKKQGGATAQPAPSAPVVTDDATDILFTWIDERGDFHVEMTLSAIPLSGRDLVKVGEHRDAEGHVVFVYVANLTTRDADGKYPVREAPREELEKIALERRRKHGLVLGPTPVGAPTASSSGATATSQAKVAVIIYGAEWCMPCHEAAKYLEKKGVSYIKKDIEVDPAAAKEMQAKLVRAGIRSGNIPVLDVGGTMLVGFDKRRVDQALGTML